MCYHPTMPTTRKCLVTFRDKSGVEHAVDIPEAESLYEAAILALHRFRDADWSREASLDVGKLRVEVWNWPTVYNVEVAEVEAWFKRPGGTPHDVALRSKLRSLIDTNDALSARLRKHPPLPDSPPISPLHK
jgi:hypothetical protein